jgi:hypothetical protein
VCVHPLCRSAGALAVHEVGGAPAGPRPPARPGRNNAAVDVEGQQRRDPVAETVGAALEAVPPAEPTVRQQDLDGVGAGPQQAGDVEAVDLQPARYAVKPGVSSRSPTRLPLTNSS